jgi:hypothetical protein
MPQYVELPNGDLVELRKGQRPEDAYLAAMQLFPDAFQEEVAPPPEPPKEQGSYLGDLGRSFASGAVGATGALTSIFGADNAASRYLAETGESLQKGLSTSRQAELQAQAARMKKAEESGSTWEEIKAGLLNVLEAPIQTTASALGSFAPMVATLPLAKIGLGARAIMAVRGAIGGAQGAGAVKQNVYEAVLQAELEDKKSPEEAQAAAARAQSYVGENLDQILLGGGLGVVAGSTGAERLIPGGVRAQAGAAQQALAKRIGERGATGLTAAAGEFPLEGLQGGQERLAANLALQRTGRDVDAFTGVAGQATQEALAGGLGGAALGVALPDRSMSIAARKAEEERLAQEAKKDADYKASDEYALDIASKYEQATQQLQSLQEQKRKIVKNSPTVDEDREHNTNISNQIRAVRQQVGYDALKEQYQGLAPRINQLKRMTEMTPEDALAEDIGIPSTPTRDPRTGAPRRRAVMSGEALPEGVDAEAFPSAPVSAEEQIPYYVQQQLSAATQRAKQEAIDNNPELALAGIDASQGVRLSGEQMIEALAEDPGRAMAVAQTRGALPGMSIEQANLVRAGLRSRLSQLGSEMGIGREQADARRAEIEREIQALRDMGSRPASYAIRERELRAELDEINKLARMDTSQTAQGTLFPQDTLRSDVVSGSGVVDGTPTRAKLEADLQLARVLGDKKAAERTIEELRELKQRETKESTPRGTDTRALQEVFGSKQPQDVRLAQTASDARAVAYAKTVTLLDRFNKGKAKQNELDAAEQQVYNTLVNEIEAVRGEPVTAMERTQIIAAAKEQVQELKDRFGDTRDMVEVELNGERVLVPEDSPEAQGAVTGTGMGVARKEGRIPGRRTFANRYAAAKSIEEGLNEIRNKAIAPKRGAGVERTLTPARITDAMLDKLVERVDPNRLSDEDGALFERVQDDLPGIKKASVDGESATEIVGEYLYGLTTGNPSPTLRKEVQAILRNIDEAKRSETEQVTERAGRAYTPKEREALRGTSREGKEGGMDRRATGEVRRAVQTDMFAADIGTLFSDFLDFDNYMASTELAQVRDALDLVGETQARAQKLMAPLETRAKELQEEIARLIAQRNAAQQELDGSPEKAVAEALVQETKKALSELQADMDEALLPFNMAYWNAYAKLTEAKIASEQITSQIETQQADFSAAIDAIEKREKQKDERVTKVKNTLRTLQGYTSFYNAAKKKYDEAWNKLYGTNVRVSQKTPDYAALVADKDELQRLQKQVQDTHQKLINEMRSFWWTTDPAARKDERTLDFLQKDIALQLELRTLSRRMTGLTTARNNAKRSLDAALKALGADPELVQELNALRSDADVARTIRADVEAGLKTRMDALVKPLEAQLTELARQSDAMREAVNRYKDAIKGKQKETERRNVRVAPKAERKDTQAAIEALLPVYSSRTLVSFEKRREQIQDIISDLGKDKVAELIARVESGVDKNLVALSADERAAAVAALRAVEAEVELSREKRDATLQDDLRARAIILENLAKERDKLAGELLNQKERKAVERGANRAELEKPKRAKQQQKIDNLLKQLNERDAKIGRRTGVTKTAIKTPEQQRQEQAAQMAETRDRELDAISAAEKQVRNVRAALDAAKEQGKPKAVKNAEAALAAAQTKLDGLNEARQARLAEPRNVNAKALSDAEQQVKDAQADFDAAQESGDSVATQNARALLGEYRYKLSQLRDIQNAANTQSTGPATRKQSAAPRKLRTASEESINDKNVPVPETKIEEARGTKQRDTPVGKKEQKTANKIAKELQDAKAEATPIVEAVVAAEKKKKKQPTRAPKASKEANYLQDVIGDMYYGDDTHASVIRNADYDARPTTELPTTVKEEVRSGNLEDALVRLQEEGSTPFVRELAKLVAPYLKGVTLVSNPNVVDSNGVPVEGLYVGKDMQVQISSVTGMTEEAFLHEVVHPATLTLLRADPATLTPEQRQARQDLESLFAKVQADPRFNREYAKYSVEEMVSEVMSNNKLRNMLDERGVLQRMYDAILRMLGFSPKTVSDQAVENIYKLFAPAQPIAAARVASVMRGIVPGDNAKYNANVPESMRRSFGGSDQRSKTFNEKLSTWALGLRVKTLDAWGAREALVQMGLSGKKLTETDAMQTRIYMRLYSEINRFVHQALLNGPLKLVKDEKGYFGVDVDDKKPSVMKVLQTLRGAVPDIGNMKAVEEQFYKYMQIKRIEGDKRGYEVLNMRNPPTVREIREQKEFIAKNPKVKQAFEQAEKEFREYNLGMLDFAHAAGVFTNAEWNYFKSGNYVPFYRQTDNGNIEMLVGNTRRTIGNVIQQPQLKDLVGGEKDFLGFTESVMQNAQLLTRMSMQNLQARDVGYMVQSLGMGTIVEGEGPANSIRFKQAGKSFWVKLDADLFPKDIPAELLLQGLHGIKASVPTALKIAGMPTQWLRSSIVRMPLYMIRQMIRDPLHAWMVTGLNFTPIVSSIKEMTKIRRGLSPTEIKLMRSGAVSSNVMTGDFNDASRTLRDLANQGGMSWSSAMQSLDNFALQGDTATRAVLYDKYREQGMSHFEAALGAAEVMNFSRRGTSTSLYMISTLIPFFNAQLQGLDSVWRTGVTGETVFQDKLQVRQKLYQRAALMMGATLAYAVAMQDDEAYKNATPEERAMNWFIPVPGLEAAIRMPIPFEVGAVAKAIPELIFNAAFNDAESKDTLKGLRHVLGMSIPGDIPTIAKPIIESMANYSFFTKAPIESQRELGTIPAERYRPNTTELAKLMGQVGVSPLQVEHLVRGYTGSLGILTMSLVNPVLRPFNSDTAGENAESKLTETPFFGAAFQPNNGRGIVASVYADVEDWQQAAGTFKRLVTDGRQAEARAFADKYAREIALSSTGGSFQQAMGELAAMRRAINSDPDFSAAEKRERLNEIDLYQRKLAEQVKEVARMAK